MNALPPHEGRGRGPGAMPLAGRPDFPLGLATVQPSTLRIAGRAGSASVEPRVMRVLLAFADAGSEVLSREDLLRRCWDGAIVGDDAINRTVAEIRRLARETQAGFGIETIPRVGYRLTVSAAQPTVTPSAPGATAATDVAPPAVPELRPPASRRAVLGGALAFAALAVSGGGLYLRQRRAAHYEGLLTEGRELLRLGLPNDLARACAVLEQAVQLRADDPQALGLLALARYLLAGTMPTNDSRGRDRLLHNAGRAAEQALQVDASEANAGTVMALIDWRGDWHATDLRLRAVLRGDPGNFAALDNLVGLLQGAGYVRESHAFNEQALGFDEHRPMPAWRNALKLWILERPADAVSAANAALDRWSTHQFVWQAALVVFAFTGDFGAARRLLEQPGDMLSDEGRDAWRHWLQALEQRTPAAIRAAHAATSRVALRPILASHAILVLADLDQRDAAYELFESRTFLPAVQTTEGTPYENAASRWHQWLFCPAAANLHTDPRFERACERLGLFAYWRARGMRPDGLLATWRVELQPASTEPRQRSRSSTPSPNSRASAAVASELR